MTPMLQTLLFENLFVLYSTTAGFACSYALLPNEANLRRLILAPALGTILLSIFLTMWLTLLLPVDIVPLIIFSVIAGMCWSFFCTDKMASLSVLTRCLLVSISATSLLFVIAAPILSFDSYEIVFLSWALHSSDGIQLVLQKLSNFPIFIPITQSAAALFSLDFHSTLQPLFMLTSAALIVFHVQTEFPDSSLNRWLKLVLVLLCAFTSHFVVHQSFYVNSHTTAGFLILFAFLQLTKSWSDDSVKQAILFSLTLVALCFVRLEGMLYATFFLIALIGQARPKHHVTMCTLLTPALAALWYGRLIASGGDGFIGGGPRFIALLTLLCGPALLSALPHHKTIQWLKDNAPAITIALLLLGLTSTFLYRPEPMTTGLLAFVSNAVGVSPWLTFWPVVILCIFLQLTRRSVPSQSLFTFILSAIILSVITMNILAEKPYRLGWGDSANRILVHTVPLFCLFLAYFFCCTTSGKATSAKEQANDKLAADRHSLDTPLERSI